MTEKKASVHWEGAGKTGQGQVSTETGVLDKHPYGFGSRFGDDRKGTNPEEIVGAAHAACFTMAFAFACEKAGVPTRSIDTTAAVRLAKDGEGFKIDRIALALAGLSRAFPVHAGFLFGHGELLVESFPVWARPGLRSVGHRRQGRRQRDAPRAFPDAVGSAAR